jgi:hypothetical protein
LTGQAFRLSHEDIAEQLAERKPLTNDVASLRNASALAAHLFAIARVRRETDNHKVVSATALPESVGIACSAQAIDHPGDCFEV